METGAVIVAAGLSSRMGAFKPMLRIGSISVANRVISTLQQSGVKVIVVVTGNQADILEKHLSRSGVVFVHNPLFAETQMLDSVKIGLSYIMDKCDRILFTPVDVPFFTSETVATLFECPEKIVIPLCDGKEGHPLLLNSNTIPQLLKYDGNEGLRGAITASGEPIRYVDVDDEGILCDIDTPNDYNKLIYLHNKQLFRPVFSLSLAREDPFFGSNEAMLLGLIQETGSVKDACTRMKLSYSKGWKTLKQISADIGAPIISSNQGGMDGGSTVLTEQGLLLLGKYKDFESDCYYYIEKSFIRHFSEK